MRIKKILIFALVALMTLTFAGCGKRTAITPDAFTKTIEAKGYSVTDDTEDYDSEKVNASLTAENEEGTIGYQYYDIITDSDTTKAFESFKTTLDEELSGGSQTSLKLGNYENVSISSGDDYAYIARIDNTIICVCADSAHKDEAKETVKSMGY